MHGQVDPGCSTRIMIPGDEKREDREGPGFLEIDHPGKFPRSWPAAKVLHEIVGPATLWPKQTLSGSGVEMSVVDIFTFLNSHF